MDTVPLSKKSKLNVDVVIVGQGIAGSVLALSLTRAGYNVCVIDQPSLSLSSKVAAGIWNPIVFKRLTKSWLADDLVPELIHFYSHWEKEFQTALIHHRHIIKPFSEEHEKSFWLKKANDTLTKNQFLDSVTYENLQIDNNYFVKSYSKVLQAGNLDVVNFLENTKTYLSNHHNYLSEVFDFYECHISSQEINYKSISAKTIIFCEGHLISKNPYFNWIPMKPAKGETLTIRSENLKLEQDIFNKGFFIMPLGNNLYKVGATYEWNELNDLATEKGQLELIQKLESIIHSPYQIISHDAGVRPSVIDRRPVIGHHPHHQNVMVFNGLGTKAVMIAPYFAKKLVNAISYQAPIDLEVDPLRFKKLM
jgi:glycine/D-amino acid oxidase-like deaminating enzyme